MLVQVLFFGQLRDLVGTSSDELQLDESASVGTVWERYASENPKLRAMASSIAIARNQEFVRLDAPLADGDEIAFMPPVSGGSDIAVDDAGLGWIVESGSENAFYALTRRPLDPRFLVKRLQADADGAVITFEGVTRNNTKGRRTRYLDYDCYPPMALAKMREIGHDLLDKHDIRAVGIIHRVGKLEIREASVIIVVCSAHRRAAYEASLEAIDRLKQLVPIWKKEYFEDGEVWVEGDWDEAVPRASGGTS